MTRFWRRRPALAAAASLVVLLAGCGGLLPKPPERPLYRLVPAFAFPNGLPQVAAQLVVAAPSAQGGLDTSRIALTRSAVALDYFADGEWTDHAPALIQSALIDGFEKSGAIAAVAPENLGLNADFVLQSELANFAAVYDSPDKAPRAVIRLDVKLVRLPERKIIAQATLGGEAPAASNTLPDIVAAFDRAVGSAASDAVTWTLRNPALSEAPRSVISRSRFVHPIRGKDR